MNIGAARRLSSQLRTLGLAAGRDVLIHSSLRRVGPVPGGAATVVRAIRDAIGPQSCVVVPTQTSNNSTTSAYFHRVTDGLDAAAVARHVAGIEGFDPAVTASCGMGALAEFVRREPSAVRSAHPQTSFAALGRGAARLMATHDLDCHLGDRSPLGALYAADASVLLLGVDYDVCTAFHLAEYRRHGMPAPIRRYECFLRDGGHRVRCEFSAIGLDDADFAKLGEAFEYQVGVRIGRFGNCVARILPLRQAVDFAVQWMDEHRWA